MRFEEFVEKVREQVQEQLPAENVLRRKILKNNGVEREALALKDDNREEMISPLCYLDGYYHEYCHGRSLQDIVSRVTTVLRGPYPDLGIDVHAIQDFSVMRERITFRVIHAKKNERLLRGVPHIDFLDLSIVFYCWFGNFSGGQDVEMLVTKDTQEVWGVGIHELYRLSQENTPRFYPHQVSDIDDLMLGLIIEELKGGRYYTHDIPDEIIISFAKQIYQDAKNDRPFDMFVLSNKNRHHGAACMLYPGVLHSISEKMGCDIIIIPSSIHEVILVPACDIDCDFSELVNMVNEEALAEGEVLSDHAYIYLSKEDRIAMS